jgi:hypothetical protein
LPFDSYPYDPRESVVRVEFTDAAGLRWTRTMGEPPERVLFPPALHIDQKSWLPHLRRKPKSDFPADPPF